MKKMLFELIGGFLFSCNDLEIIPKKDNHENQTQIDEEGAKVMSCAGTSWTAYTSTGMGTDLLNGNTYTFGFKRNLTSGQTLATYSWIKITNASGYCIKINGQYIFNGNNYFTYFGNLCTSYGNGGWKYISHNITFENISPTGYVGDISVRVEMGMNTPSTGSFDTNYTVREGYYSITSPSPNTYASGSNLNLTVEFFNPTCSTCKPTYGQNVTISKLEPSSTTTESISFPYTFSFSNSVKFVTTSMTVYGDGFLTDSQTYKATSPHGLGGATQIFVHCGGIECNSM